MSTGLNEITLLMMNGLEPSPLRITAAAPSSDNQNACARSRCHIFIERDPEWKGLTVQHGDNEEHRRFFPAEDGDLRISTRIGTWLRQCHDYEETGHV